MKLGMKTIDIKSILCYTYIVRYIQQGGAHGASQTRAASFTAVCQARRKGDSILYGGRVSENRKDSGAVWGGEHGNLQDDEARVGGRVNKPSIEALNQAVICLREVFKKRGQR